MNPETLEAKASGLAPMVLILSLNLIELLTQYDSVFVAALTQ